MSKNLVAYYSRRGENYVDGRIQNLDVGNTEIAAGMVRLLTHGDLFRIEPVQEYSPDYCTCIDQARQDLCRGVRLELKRWPMGFDRYETIYLGYPNHWNTLPVAVLSFVEKLDFTGKTIFPFCIHEGDGLGRSEAELRRLCPGARIIPGLPIRSADVKYSMDALEDWLKDTNI
ncbi:flavodoxin [Oscillospiraceae bacterium 44-5]